jgi:CheY-like chemotaxis protein
MEMRTGNGNGRLFACKINASAPHRYRISGILASSGTGCVPVSFWPTAETGLGFPRTMQPTPTYYSATIDGRRTIVVADNAPDVRSEITAWLEELGHRVISVSSGNEAIRAIRLNEVHVVITEIIMPDGDGLEVILEARKQPVPPSIISISGGGRYLPTADCLRVAKSLGAHATLPKPVAREALEAALRRVLEPDPTAQAH